MIKLLCEINRKYFFFTFLIISFLFIKNQNKNKSDIKETLKEIIYYNEKFSNITEAFNHAKPFLDKCLRNILIKNQIFNSPENLRVSTIIPLYNCEKTIQRAIKSIQNQNITDLEIILVNDNSIDDTLSIIEKIQKDDSRIKIINNRKNMGTLYSRSIGGLSSKGEYIFHLDSDDMFLDEDVFSTMINISKKGNFDITAFKAIASYGKHILTSRIKVRRFTDHISNKVLFQPELGSYPLKPGEQYGSYLINDNYLWNKCIRTKVYQAALNKIGKERYSRYMIYEEDRMIIYVLFNIAESIKYLGKFGVLKTATPGSMTRRKYPSTKFFLCKLYYVDIVIDFTKESYKNKRSLVYLITYLLKKNKLKEIEKLNDYNKKLFISCLERVLNDKYISNKDKKEIRKKIFNINFLNNYFNS